MIAPDQLPPRKQEVAALIADGKSQKQICALLGIRRVTLTFHIRQIVARLPASDLAPSKQIALWVIHWRWEQGRREAEVSERAA